jgi:hypothetical protein
VPERLNGPVLKTGARKCRGFESHPLRHARLLAALALIAGCSFLPGRQFAFGFPARDGIPELRGVLTDTTGSVTKVTTIGDMHPVPPIDRGMTMLGDDGNSVIAYWMDACDESVAIAVTPDGGTTIAVTTKPSRLACDLPGIRRYVRIQFAAPLDPNRTSITFAP